MPFDGTTISCLTKELNQLLVGQRIDKIFQPEKDELTLIVRGKKGSHRLTISINARWGRMYISQERRENPLQPSAFCMLLRKHLEGAKITGFAQQSFDRIVHLKVEALNDFMEWQEKILVCEFTGKYSNVVLIDPEKNTIIDGMKRYGSELSSFREIQPGTDYVPPPTQDKLIPGDFDYSTFYNRLWSQESSDSLARALFRAITGLSLQTSTELCRLADIDPEIPVGECGDYELSRLYSVISDLESLPGSPTVSVGSEGLEDYFIFSPTALPNRTLLTFPTINEALDHFYLTKMTQTRLESIRSNISRNVKGRLNKAYRKLMYQEDDLHQAQKSDLLRIKGELLTTYGFQIKKGDTKVILPNFDGNGETEMELLPYLTPQENAQRYFKQYAKARTARIRLTEFIQQNREEILYLESIAVALEKADSINEIEEVVEELAEQGYMRNKLSKKKARATKSPPRRFATSEGLTVLVGRNNLQNDQLTLKLSRKNDIWLHTQGYAGTHVILQPDPPLQDIDQVPVASLEEAAILAAYYSKGKEADKVPIDYTFRSNVKKPRGARPGMVIYDNYWTINVNPSDSRLQSLLKSQIE